MRTPPLALIFVVQIFAVLSDTMLQRAFRVEYGGSPRRSILAATIGAAVVTAIIVGLLELFAPIDLTADCFNDDGKLLTCCDASDSEAVSKLAFKDTCGVGPFPDDGRPTTQGVSTMFIALTRYPFLLLNGMTAIIYHICEVVILKHSIGPILKVNACLGSTFLINTFVTWLVPMEHPVPISPLLVMLAAFGATLSALSPRQLQRIVGAICPLPQGNDIDQDNKEDDGDLEKEYWTNAKKNAIKGEASHDELRPIVSKEAKEKDSPTLLPPSSSASEPVVLQATKLSFAFGAMLVSSALWAAMQRYAQVSCGVNHTGYVAIDQVAGGMYILAYVYAVSFEPLRSVLLWKEDAGTRRESFSEAFARTVQESFCVPEYCSGALLIGFAKIFASLRLVGQFLLLVSYNPALVMLEMNVVRLLVSWISSLFFVVVRPSLMGITPRERAKALQPATLLTKMLGSSILISLLAVANGNGAG